MCISASWSLQSRSRCFSLAVSVLQFRSRILCLATWRSYSQISVALSRFRSLDLVVFVSPFGSCSLGLVVSVGEFLGLSFTETSSHDVQVPPNDALTWCEALSLKFTEPYYVDFSVNSQTGKVRNF